ncbi:DoxX family membrane protein [Paenibacillus alginolyticus]|uniref:DoxX family membrane protein n=1 Tax=Paenibacillus alginolyticus TaxID=59839 RepID=A0ABT4GE52_9BACL|nr:DoxX family membrane protein [Paenibacillus alginolyticus]MCY9667049.1 DoxX family membrane protein [Paenibacillus alginolyticus]MCY9694463.1 DoxX family membrane protein [Paenibacillus alginolyticus]MEC0142049.1 DoxX family membrane protein [Paenibacillus alginolyticus]
MMKWLRGNRYAAMMLTIIRLYVGWQWMTAGWHKIAGAKPFDAAGYLKGAIAKPVLESGTTDMVYANYVAFLKNFALPNVGIFNTIVPWGELLVGLGLILGALTTTAIFFGLLMNFMYMFAGTVSSNPWLVLLGFFIIAAGANAGKFGVDHLILPYLHKWFDKLVDRLHLKPKYK